METAVGFIGGGMAVAGAVTVLKRARRTPGSLRFGIGLIVGGLVLIALAVVLVVGPLQRSKPKTSTPGATAPAPAVKPPAVVDPWADPDIPAIREEVRAAYAEYERVVHQAGLENKPELLDQVATGEQLALLKDNLRRTQELGLALLHEDQATVWAITPTPQYRNVSVQVKGTFRTWDIDPKTGQKVGDPLVKLGEANPVFVWSDGRWKVSSTVFFEGS